MSPFRAFSVASANASSYLESVASDGQDGFSVSPKILLKYEYVPCPSEKKVAEKESFGIPF